MSDEQINQPADGLSENPEIRALQETMFQIRSLETSILLDRLRWASHHGVTFDGKRQEYSILGYDYVVTYKQYQAEYARGGIAGAVVDVMPDACWRGETPFEVIEDEDPEHDTEFEQAWKTISLKHNAPVKLQRADKLARLSTYSVVLIGAPGLLSEELPKSNTGADALLFLKPYSGGGGPGDGERQSLGTGARATILAYDEDPRSERFGEPLFYQINFFQRRIVAGEPTLPQVHWSRIVHFPADNPLEDDIFGQPALERVWNLLADLRKVTGGGSEAFWLRANQGLHLDVDKDLALQKGEYDDVLTKLKAEAEAYKHQLDRWIRTRGVKINTLGSDVANFANPADAIVTQIAGAKRTPKRVLTGSEMGELASTQDRENFRDQVNGRQAQHCAPVVRQLVDRLVKYGYMPAPARGPLEYQVKWPKVEVQTETEKADGATKWSQTKVGEDPVFTSAEIRDKWYGLPPLTQEQMAEIDERKAEAVKRQQEAMAAAAPPQEKDEEELRAAEARELYDAQDREMLRLLTEALRVGNVEVVSSIIGLSGFDEEKHPRDQFGKFTDSGGGGSRAGSKSRESSHPTFPLPDTPGPGGAAYELEDDEEGALLTIVSRRPDGSYYGASDKFDFSAKTAGEIREKLKKWGARYVGWELKDSEARYARSAERLSIVRDVLRALDFDPDQARDERGRWTKGGGGEGGGKEEKLIGKPSSHFEKARPEGTTTKEQYRLPNGRYTPERRQLHDEIIAKHLEGRTPVENPVALILGGGPASGKSTLEKAQGLSEGNKVLINPDEVKGMLPEYGEEIAKGNPNASLFAHEESSDVSKRMMNEASEKGYNVVLDGTGDSDVEKLGGKIAAARAAGHRIVAKYVTLPTDMAWDLSNKRGQKTGRFVPEDYLRDTHSAVSRTFAAAIEQGLFDEAELYDTTRPGDMRKVVSARGKNLTVHDERLWRTFLAKGSER